MPRGSGSSTASRGSDVSPFGRSSSRQTRHTQERRREPQGVGLRSKGRLSMELPFSVRQLGCSGSLRDINGSLPAGCRQPARDLWQPAGDFRQLPEFEAQLPRPDASKGLIAARPLKENPTKRRRKEEAGGGEEQETALPLGGRSDSSKPTCWSRVHHLSWRNIPRLPWET